MSIVEIDARLRIIKAAMEILDETSDIDKITVRQIAERAKVGVGTINYHFDSKDNLLGVAVGNILSQMAVDLSRRTDNIDTDPIMRLKNMLKELCNTAEYNEKLIRFMITQEIMEGKMNALLHLIPVLRDIFGDKKKEFELRVIALQILQPLQIAILSPATFHMYSSFDLHDKDKRNTFIDMLVNNVIN